MIHKIRFQATCKKIAGEKGLCAMQLWHGKLHFAMTRYYKYNLKGAPVSYDTLPLLPPSSKDIMRHCIYGTRRANFGICVANCQTCISMGGDQCQNVNFLGKHHIWLCAMCATGHDCC